MAENETETAPQGVTDVKDIYNFCQDQIAQIEKLDKKSNYHNARRSAYKAIANLIVPPAPKPKKEPKAKAAKAGAEGATVDQPAASTEVDTTHVEPVDEAA